MFDEIVEVECLTAAKRLEEDGTGKHGTIGMIYNISVTTTPMYPLCFRKFHQRMSTVGGARVDYMGRDMVARPLWSMLYYYLLFLPPLSIY